MSLEWDYLVNRQNLSVLERVKLLTNSVVYPFASEIYDDDGNYAIDLTEEQINNNDFIKYFVEYRIKFACYKDLFNKIPKKCSLDLPDLAKELDLSEESVNYLHILTENFPYHFDQQSIINMELFFRKHKFDYEHILKMYTIANEFKEKFGKDYEFWFENGETFETGLRYRLKEVQNSSTTDENHSAGAEQENPSGSEHDQPEEIIIDTSILNVNVDDTSEEEFPIEDFPDDEDDDSSDYG
jgi:hypothetical protein